MGNTFNAKLDNKKPYLDGNPVYAKDEKKGKYVIIDDRKKSIPNFSDKYKHSFQECGVTHNLDMPQATSNGRA